MISQRHMSRVAAMQALYAFLLQDKTADDSAAFLEHALNELPKKIENTSFARKIYTGCIKNRTEITEKITEKTTHKNLNKIDTITLSVLFIGTFELLFDEEKQPAPIIMNEAIEIAKEYGKDSSAPLVNAILSKLSQ
ncbi:transcription antitermination factor NusB [Candidatus Peregrinibacteria bacterium]|nr:MAG: transcription antitermination factor NusB [Candidatus Peregrinibacteria bacterium]